MHPNTFLNPVILSGRSFTHESFRAQLLEEQAGALASLGHHEWSVPDACRAKVDATGTLKPFHGDTVVLPLEPEAIARLRVIQGQLIEGGGEWLSDPLEPSTFHVTLHDLSASLRAEELRDGLESNREQVRNLFGELGKILRDDPSLARVTLRATRIFPCMNISVLAGFSPVSERDFRVLMNAHALFDEVVVLGYWLRPHVTLAYFRPMPPPGGERQALIAALGRLNDPDLEIVLDLRDLAYQRFTSMNHYETEFRVREALKP
ncbi:MAG: hypothetical protein AB1486_14110 [Planctomycetota bacterium]